MESVRQFVARSVGEIPQTLTPLARGQRHRLWLAGLSEDNVVIARIALEASERAREKARKEAAVLSAPATPGPVLLGFEEQPADIAAPAFCMEYIAGEQISLQLMETERATALGRLIAEVHTLDTSLLLSTAADAAPSITGAVRPLLEREIASRAWILAELDARTERRLASLLRQYESWRSTLLRALDRSVIPHVIHGDISRDNLLWTKAGPRLVDWENVRLGDPAQEFAYLVTEADASAPVLDGLLSGYGDTDIALYERIHYWIPVELLSSAMWWFERSLRSVPATAAAFSHNKALERLDRIERCLSDR